MEWIEHLNKNVNMKTNEEILIEFGKLLVEKGFDWSLSDFENLRTFSKSLKINDPQITYLQSLSKEDYEKLLTFIPYLLMIQLIGVLSIFQAEESQYRLIYNGNESNIDLATISDGLSTEVATEYGWVSQFSKVLKDNQRIPPLLALPELL
jgi:hypothetical protein